MARGRLTWIKPGKDGSGIARASAYPFASSLASGAGAAGAAAYYNDGAGVRVRTGRAGEETRPGALDQAGLASWLRGEDPETGELRGAAPVADSTVAVDMTINHAKSMDVLTLLGGDAAASYRRAHERCCAAVRRTVAAHAVTRVRGDGVQRVYAADGLEWVLAEHETSRLGDPELHTHQLLSIKTHASGSPRDDAWRAVWTTPLRASWHLAQTVADVTLVCDPELRRALSVRGLGARLDDDGTAHVDALEDAARVLSKRHDEIARVRAELAEQWRKEHGGAEPDARAARDLDQLAWSRTREAKTDGSATPDPAAWRAELAAQGVQVPAGDPSRAHDAPVPDPPAWHPDGEAEARMVRDALGLLAHASAVSLVDAERAAWVAAGRDVLSRGAAADEGTLRRAVAQVARGISAQLVSLTAGGAAKAQAAPWVRAWTTPQAMAEEAELTSLCRALGEAELSDRSALVDAAGLDAAQAGAARAVASGHGLVVVTGAAGSGKTTMLRAACDALDAPLLLSPTARGAEEMASATGMGAATVASFAARTEAPGADLAGLAGRTIVIDEAGMLAQADAARVMRIARTCGARVVLLGDQAQLGAVGRGGVMGIARGLCAPGATATLDVLHRYHDPAWASLTLDARAGKEDVADRLADRDDDPVPGLECSGALSWGGDDERIAGALARAWADGRGTRKDGSDTLISCTTNAQARAVNAHVQALLIASGELSGDGVPGMDGDRIHAGDRIQTRLNDRILGVCNRDTWTVRAVRADGSLDLEAPGRHARVPAGYVRDHVQLAYATTTYGAQGATARRAIHWAAQGAGSEDIYVGMTRGALSQRLVVSAGTRDEAVEQVAQSLASSRADLGVAQARVQAQAELDTTPAPAPASAPAHEDDKPQPSEYDEPDMDDDQDDEPQLTPQQREQLGWDCWLCLDWWQVASGDLARVRDYPADGDDLTLCIASRVMQRLSATGHPAPRSPEDDLQAWEQWRQDAANEMAWTMHDWETDPEEPCDLTDMRQCMDDAIARRSIDPPQQQMQPTPSADTSRPGIGIGI